MKNLYCATGTSPTSLKNKNLKSLLAGIQSARLVYENLLTPDNLYSHFKPFLIDSNPVIQKLDFYYDFKSLFDKKIWTLKDLIRGTGLKAQTVYNLVSQGRIPHSKRGKRPFFSSVEIQNWIQEGDLT